MTSPSQKKAQLAQYFAQAELLETELRGVRKAIKRLVNSYTKQCD